MRQDGLQVVRIWIREECKRRCERRSRVARRKVNVRVEDLSNFRRNGAPDLLADAVGRDDAGEGKHAGRECRVVLIEADGVQSVGAAGVGHCRACQRRW